MSQEPSIHSFSDQEIRISRMESIRCQINAGIKAYFLWEDYASVVTLIGAAERVLSDLQPQDGLLGFDAVSLRSLINLHIKDQFAKEAAHDLRAPYDFLRHADRNKYGEFVVHPVWVEFTMFLTTMAYQHVSHSLTKDMQIFMCWCLSKHPNWSKESSPIRSILEQTGFQAGDITKAEYYNLASQFFAQ